MTISEIAKMAGVSSAAVSRYLNGGSVSEEKKERIRAMIEQTGYVPSASARSLRTKRTHQIGVIVPKINSESVPRMVAGITKVLDEANHSLILGNTDNDTSKELKFLELFANSQLDGVIFVATILSQRHINLLRKMEIPVVILGQFLPAYTCVYYDDIHAAFDVTKVLLKNTIGHVGYIGVTQKDKAAGYNRRKGFLQALEEINKQAVLTEIESEFSVESGYFCMAQLLERDAQIDAVFCATDAIATGAIAYLRRIGKRIPEEIRIVGIGHNQLGDVITPELTTVHYYYESGGEEAATMLLNLISNVNQPVKHTILGYKVIERGTTE